MWTGMAATAQRAASKRVLVSVRKHLMAALVVAFVATAAHLFSFNQTTIALSLLLGVLYEATVWGLAAAITTSVLAVFAFNFFFMPPYGTLTIDDPQNWVALAAFLVTAVTASQLSARAERRAEEALAQRSEAERLYEFGRAMLVNESVERTVQAAVADFIRIFGVESAAFAGAHAYADETTLQSGDPAEQLFDRAISAGRHLSADGWDVVPVRLGVSVIGSLGVKAAWPMNMRTIDSASNLLAIALERKYAMMRAAQLETARQGEQLRAALLDGLAHDLKTPLTAIKASATALDSQRSRFDGAAAEYVSIISEEADRLDIAVSEAIETARLGAGSIAVRKELCAIGEVLRGVVAERSRYSERTRITLSDPNTMLPLDRELMRLVFRQLIDNAVKYSPESEQVEISVSGNEHAVQIAVADRGPGIDSKDRSRVFDKFCRGTAGRQVAGGSGMGLSVAKTIVEAHGGSISALPRDGGGAVFVVALPMRAEG